MGTLVTELFGCSVKTPGAYVVYSGFGEVKNIHLILGYEI